MPCHLRDCHQRIPGLLKSGRKRPNYAGPQYSFPGLKEGDRWCLCALRWKEAYDAGTAPMVVLEATSEAALQHISRSVLEEFAFGAQRIGRWLRRCLW